VGGGSAGAGGTAGSAACDVVAGGSGGGSVDDDDVVGAAGSGAGGACGVWTGAPSCAVSGGSTLLGGDSWVGPGGGVWAGGSTARAVTSAVLGALEIVSATAEVVSVLTADVGAGEVLTGGAS
jgi:hypothetical protein